MLAPDTLRSALATLDGLGPVDDSALHAAALEASSVEVSAPGMLFDEGDRCTAFGIVRQGLVRVTATSQAGRELVLYRVGKGEACTLTVSCLLGDTRYPARGLVERNLDAVVIPAASFRAFVESCPTLRAWVFALMSRRMTSLMQLVSEVAFGKLDQRIAAVLVERGPLLDSTHQALAADVGTSREIVSRVLESFQDQGLVRLARRQVEVLDSTTLESIASGRI